MFFNKEKLKEFGKAGGELAKDYVKEESKSFFKDLIQGFLIKISLILIIGGIAIYFLFSGYFYAIKKAEEVKVATTEYVSDKKENINNSINNIKTNVEDITNKTIDSIEVKKDSVLNKIDVLKENVNIMSENVINSIENKTEESVVENKSIVENKPVVENQDIVEKENKINNLTSKLKDTVLNTKEKLIEIKE